MTDSEQKTSDSPRHGKRIGEYLLSSGLITSSNLQQGLKRQGQAGGKLGSNLIEMGFIGVDDLLGYLSAVFGVPGLNIFTINIASDVLSKVPREKMEEHRILPVSFDDKTLTLAMTNPKDHDIIKDIEFTLGKKVSPVVCPAYMLDTAINSFLQNPGSGIIGHVLAEMVELGRGEKLPNMEALLLHMVKTGGDDLLLTPGASPSMKSSNRLRRLTVPALTAGDCERYARELLPFNEWEKFQKKQDYGLSISVPKIGRFRVTLYRQRDAVSIAIRPIFEKVPTLKELNLPQWIADIALKPQGLILVSGPAGHGKSTTLSAMVDIINTTEGRNIITLEDPIEYIHKHKQSNINQREIGRDVGSFSEGMRHALRQAPDVIVVGEMRDRETFEIALQAAISGHLVISTVHSDNATSIIERVVNMFEPHEQAIARMMLAESFIVSIAQRLIPKKDRQGRILALEKLASSHRVKKMIREGKTHQIRSQMQMGGEDFLSIDISLADLYKKGFIEFEDGLLYADDEKLYKDLVKG
jgi:twitching motility protein PilT